MVVCVELRLHGWPDGGCGDTERRLQEAKSICAKRRHGTMPTWVMSRGEGFERRACRCCHILLLLVAAAAPNAGVARGYKHALQMM